MRQRLRLTPLIAVMTLLFGAAAAVHGQTYSYLDENGVRIYTNIPPTNQVGNLMISGASPAASGIQDLSGEDDKDYDSIIEKYAAEFQVDPDLVRSMIAAESAYNPKAVSRKGAQGLMQLMPATAARLGVKHPFDPEENIRGGVRHMRALLDTFGNDLTLSLAAYNAGENLVQRIGRIPNYPETHNYIRTVTERYGKKEIAPTETVPIKPPMFRYRDENGVLVLTNIPPSSGGAAADAGPR